jgi:thymidine kinase
MESKMASSEVPSVKSTAHCSQCQDVVSHLAPFQSGQLSIYVGPMFSGKSSKLLQELSTYADIGMRTLYVNHADDIRSTQGDSVVSTHSSQYSGLSKRVDSKKTALLAQVDTSPYQVIGVDESQFFDDLVPTVTRWVQKERKIVVCVGLDGDAFMKPFGHLLELIPLADTVVKLTAKCHRCLENLQKLREQGTASVFSGQTRIIPGLQGPLCEAPFTLRLTTETSQKIVGGADKYIPVCRYHHT